MSEILRLLFGVIKISLSLYEAFRISRFESIVASQIGLIVTFAPTSSIDLGWDVDDTIGLLRLGCE